MQVQYHPGTGQQFYSTIPNIAGNSTWSALPPKYFNSYVDSGFLKLLGSSAKNAQSALPKANYSTDYTPNQYTARQLAELQSGAMGGGGNTIPAWMHNAFANKMGRMGAPTTEPFPYQITGSSFRGMPAGKAAPTGGQ